MCESGCKSGWRLYYLYTPGLQDKEGRSESPPFCSPNVAPIRSSVALISLPPPPRAGRCGGGSRLRGSSVAKVRLLTSKPLLLSMNSSRRLGTALATRLQTSSPPVGRGEGGLSKHQRLWLKGKLSKFQQQGRVALQSTRSPPNSAPMSSARGHTGWTLAHARTHTRVHIHAHSCTHTTSRCVGLKLLPSRG